MTVTTQTTSGQMLRPGAKSRLWFYAVWLALPGLVLLGARDTLRRRATVMGLALALAFFLIACGSGSNGGGTNGGGSGPVGNGQQGTIPGTYTITVIGSPASIAQPNGSNVALTVQ